MQSKLIAGNVSLCPTSVQVLAVLYTCFAQNQYWQSDLWGCLLHAGPFKTLWGIKIHWNPPSFSLYPVNIIFSLLEKTDMHILVLKKSILDMRI